MQIGSDRKCAALASDRNDILFEGKERKGKERRERVRKRNAKAPKGSLFGKEGADDGIPFCLRLRLEWEGGRRPWVEERRRRRVGGPPARRSSFKLASRSF